MNHDTHYACKEQLGKLGGKTPCCYCIGHTCDTTNKEKVET